MYLSGRERSLRGLGGYVAMVVGVAMRLDGLNYNDISIHNAGVFAYMSGAMITVGDVISNKTERKSLDQLFVKAYPNL
jgi:hypothetical protein